MTMFLESGFGAFIGQNLREFWSITGFANATWGHIVMIAVGLFFLYLGIKHKMEPMLLVPLSAIFRSTTECRLASTKKGRCSITSTSG